MHDTTRTTNSAGRAADPTPTIDSVRRDYFVRERLKDYREFMTRPSAGDPITGQGLADGWMRYVMSGQCTPDANGSLNEAYRAYKARRLDEFLRVHEAFLRRSPIDFLLGGDAEPKADISVNVEDEQRKGRDELIRTMHSKGASLAQIAGLTGLSKSAVGKITLADRPPRTGH